MKKKIGKSRKYRVAMIGVGDMTTLHAPAYRGVLVESDISAIRARENIGPAS